MGLPDHRDTGHGSKGHKDSQRALKDHLIYAGIEGSSSCGADEGELEETEHKSQRRGFTLQEVRRSWCEGRVHGKHPVDVQVGVQFWGPFQHLHISAAPVDMSRRQLSTQGAARSGRSEWGQRGSARQVFEAGNRMGPQNVSLEEEETQRRS